MKTINNIINFKSLATSINAAYYPIYDLVTQTRFTNYFSLGLNNKGVRFFSTSSPPYGGINKEWEDHVMDLIEYGDQYIDHKSLEIIGERIYKKGVTINITEMDNNNPLSGTYIQKEKLQDFIDNTTNSTKKTKNNIYPKSYNKHPNSKFINNVFINKNNVLINSKSNINRVKLYFKDKNMYLDLLKPNILFLKKYLCKPGSSSYILYRDYLNFYLYGFYNGWESKSKVIDGIFTFKLHYYKQNNFIKNKNYFVFFVNTPYNIIFDCAIHMINLYYHTFPDRRDESFYCKMYSNKHGFNYELLSLYYELGYMLVTHYFKYKYTKYLEDNNIKIHYSRKNNTGPVIITNKEDFLSYTEFKKELILKDKYSLNTDDYVEYGRDIYLFLIFNTYLLKSYKLEVEVLKKTRKKVKNSTSKELINIDNISYNGFNTNLGKLGHFYPSRSIIKKLLIRDKGTKIYGYNKHLDHKIYYHTYSINNTSYMNKSYLLHGSRYTSNINKVRGKYNVFIKPLYNIRSFSITTPLFKDIKIDNSFKYDSSIYKSLNTLILSNPINKETQIKLEESLLNYSYISFSNKTTHFSSVDYSLINSNLTKILQNKSLDLIKLINIYKKDMKVSKVNPNKTDIVNIEIGNIISKINNQYIINITYGRILKILSSYNRSIDNLNYMVNVSSDLGRDILDTYYYKEYLKEKEKYTNEIYYLSNWKSNNKNIVDKYEDSTLIFMLGCQLINWAITCDLLEIKIVISGKTEKVNVLFPTEILTKTISKNTLLNFPKRIPMIVPPKPYTKKNLGGYLLNDELTTNYIIKKKWNNSKQSTVKDNNIIYNLINNISSVAYKINKDVLEFILEHSHDYFKDEIINLNYKHPFLEKSKLVKSEKIELDSFLSKKELQENILGLASVFSDIPHFYIPVDLDFRGRLYCIPEYLNYQSTDLAKALLLFSKPEKIYKTDNTSINYLKIFGASCFGLDKKSFNDRLDWVDSNTQNIIDFRNGELINKAKNKFLFLAFCFEYNRWLICLENNDITFFETHLPVQMDATCNGFQHLSLLSLDTKLGLELNLSESTWNDIPKDFYGFLVYSLMDYFNSEINNNKDLSIETKNGYRRLIEFGIKRDIIKKSVMTIPYNVSNFQQINYIKDNFERIDKSEWYCSKENKELKLKNSDFTILGNGLRKVLSYKFNKLNLLLKYLESLAETCTILQIPILWTLPSGLEVKQSYMLEDEIRLKPFHYTKNRFSLKILNKSKFNNVKQVTAFMPNLVHSLDAASLSLLLDCYFKEINGIKNIYTVHDCFSVTANNIDELISILKLTYIKIYSEDKYLIKLDKGIRDNIINVYGKKSLNEKTLEINVPIFKNPIYFPDINTVIGKNIDFDFKLLGKSSYIIN